MIWKQIPEYPLYEASDEGEIRDAKTHRLLHQCNTEGYLYVNLSIDGNSIGRTVHQLVALAFLPHDSGRTDVNHIDRVKANNNVENLEWCNTQENTKHFWSQYGTDPVENHVYLIKDEEVILVTCAESKILRQQGWKYGNGIENTPWVIKGRCYVNRGSEERLIIPEQLNEYIAQGWTRGRLLRNLRAIQKEGVQKFVSQSELQEYLSVGWSLGSIKAGCIKIIRNSETRFIQPSLLQAYEDEGWNRIRSEDNIVNIHKEKVTKTIKKEDLELYLADGWRYGAYRCGLQGRRWINNGQEDKCIDELEVESYISQGWEEGRITAGNYRKKSMVRNGIQKFFAVEEIETRMKEGWSLETTSSGNQGKIWIYKGNNQMQIEADELESFKQKGWKPGRPKNMIFVSNDTLHKCIKIPAEDRQKYLDEGWRPGRMKYK